MNNSKIGHNVFKIFIQADSQNVDTYNNFKQEYINYKATLRKIFLLPNVCITEDCSHFTKMILKKPGA